MCSISRRTICRPRDLCCPREKRYGVTLNGKAPCCKCYCDPKPCLFMIKYPKEPPPVYEFTSLYCPPYEPRGCYYADRGKNFLSRNYPCAYCPPRCCTRPCCKHWKKPASEVCCKYDDPCIAHHFDHPWGPSGRYPPDIYRCPLPDRPCRP